MQKLRSVIHGVGTILLCISLHIAAAQDVSKIEYYMDTDPGFGNGSPVSFTPAQDVTANFTINVNSMPLGFHNLYVRSFVTPYQVVENGSPVTKGGWSLTSTRQFYKENLTTSLPNIVAGEYFADSDPGFGNGVSIPVTAGTDLDNVSFAFDITSLASGFHNLYVRFKDADGEWSIVTIRTFYKENLTTSTSALRNVVKGEYFADTDPGFGNAINISFSAGTDLTNVAFAYDITSLAAGFHNLYVRFQDASGNWSLTSVRTFYKENLTLNNNALPNIVHGEHFTDADPGFGNATAITVMASSDLSNVTFAFDITSLSSGFHNLYVRFKDADGKWGLTSVRTFYKENLTTSTATLPNVVKGEYFVDTDPGFDNGINITLNPGTDINNLSFIADITSFTKGFHQIYIRFKDANGNWGLTNSRSFYKEALAQADTLSNIVRLEYFVDTDPGFGNAKVIAITPALNINNVAFEIDIDTLTLGDHKLYVRAQNANGAWSIVHNNTFRLEPPSGLYISVGQINSPLCMGSTVPVPFTVNGPFSTGNIFTAQLSDVNGSFTTPRNIGTLAGTGSGTINAIIPYVIAGNNYRIRVSASNPQRASLANTTPLSIRPIPPVFSIVGDTVSCFGNKTYTLANYESGSGKYIWSLSSGGTMDTTGVTANINWTTTGIYTITVKYNGLCAGNDSIKTKQVNVIDSGLTGTFSGMLPADGNTNLSLPITFSWLPILNATHYDLYVWPDTATRPATPTISNITAINYTISSTSIIQYEKTYRWQVVAKRACYQLQSPVHTFRLRYLPDLVVQSITPAATSFSGQSFSINWQIRNNGLGGTLQGQWYDRVYLSADAVLDENTDIYLGVLPNVSELNAGASYQRTASFTLPQGINNNYYVFVITNVYGGLQESNLNNNTGISTTTAAIQLTPPPDLRVTSIVPPNFVFSGQSMSFTWRVTNLGTGSTRVGNWADNFYLSKDTVLNFATATYLGSANHIGVLSVDSSYTGTRTVTLPDGIFGKHYLYVRTDVNNQIYEHAAENNNTSRSDSINIILTPPIDLLITQVTATPASVSNRENMTVQWRVENAGGSSTENRSWIDNIYLSKDSTFIPANTVLLASVTRPAALNAGDGYNAQRIVSIPNNLSGNYFVYVFADAANQVFEYNLDSNNIRRNSATIPILSPDLIVSTVTAPATDTSGREIEVHWKLKNNAAGKLFNTNITDRLYISASPVYNAATITELKRVTYYTGDIAAGDTLSKNALVRLPEGIIGNYYIFVQTDFTNAVYEAGLDTNNTGRSPAIQISLSPWPDLQVANVQAGMDTAVAGYTTPVSFKVVNNGTKTIQNLSWYDRLYISAAPVWDSANATLLKEFLQSRTLAKDSFYTINTTFTVPPQFDTGTYYLYLVTDTRNNVYEFASENNNRGRSIGFYVRRYPPIDIVMTAISAPDTARTGMPVTLAWSAQNRSTVATVQSQWNDALYLSLDTIWNSNDDVLVKEFSHNGLVQANQSYSNQQTAILPNNLSGSFYLLLVADHTNFNNDVNRSNNYKLVTQGSGGSPVTITISLTLPSDLQVTSFTAPFSGQAGQPISVKWKVKNTGVGMTNARHWTDRVYLSTNPVIDGGDIALGNYNRQDSLQAGAEYMDSLQVFLPLSAQGNYYLLVKADANNNVYEHNGEDNNTANAVISISRAPVSDLIVSDITIPDSAIAGENLTVQWKVKNSGQFPANGYLKDAVYLSEDSIRDVNDILLVSKDASVNLAPQTEVVQNYTGELRGAALRNYHVLVHTDVLNNIYESSDSNNITPSTNKMVVTVPLLPINVLTQWSLPDNKEVLYRIEVTDSLAGETLLVTLKGDSANGTNEIYLRYGQVPTRAVYDFSYNQPYSGNQEITVPALNTGTYYLLVTGSTTAGNTQAISLLARILPFEIRSVDAIRGGNTGPVTLLLKGSKLNMATHFYLRSGSRSIEAYQVRIIDPTKVYATFNLKDAITGVYDVTATSSSGDSTVLPDSFTIVPGTATNLITNVLTPPSTRPNNIISITVQFTNAGNTDILNPVLKLTSLGGAPIAFDPAGLTNNATELTLTLQELNGPIGVLRPGSSGTIVVYAKATTALGFMLLQSK